MKGTQRIVAVNKGASAPMFNVTDLGIIDNALIAAVEARGTRYEVDR